MKRIVYLMLFAVVILSCQSKSGDSTDSTTWQEMDAFHMVMAEAYHPYKDSSNLEPARREADALAALALEWSKAPMPKKMDTPAMRASLDQLSTESQALAAQFKSGADDTTTGAALTALHEHFHSIMEAWHQSGREEDHHEKH